MAGGQAARSEPFVYGSVLDALGQGLYPDKRHVVREFVQNACDAVREYERRTRRSLDAPIEIRLTRPSITIFDRGIGMHRNLMRRYRYVGFSEKESEFDVGFRGIGTISGIAVAKRIIVTSSRLNQPRRHKVVIDAERMLEKVRSDRNPPLEELLRDFTEVSTEEADVKEHFTLVELHEIHQDSQELYDKAVLKDYLRRVLPLPFDPAFKYGKDISRRLRLNVPDFFEVPITIDDEPLYKPHVTDLFPPEFDTIFVGDDADSSVLAYCWYCMHVSKGQFPDKKTRGLGYRVKNFAIGTPQLTRQTLWDATPERAFNFFGEIHLFDKELVPSSDRDNFEDNAARKRTYSRCTRIAQVLNRKAGIESQQRRFGEVIKETEAVLSARGRELDLGDLPADLQDEIQYEIRSALGNIAKAVKLSPQAKAVYETIVEVLREELAGQPRRLERVLKAVHTRLGQKLR